MKHAREDYNRIQDPEGKIGRDEPVFLLRAQDALAPDTLRYWAESLAAAGGDVRTVQRVRAWADKMDAWQRSGFGKMKLPDTPEE